MVNFRIWYISFLVTTLLAGDSTEVQARIDSDLAAGKPIVVHVVVALCDNLHQGIVTVQADLGNGQNPRTNLYWGALYGVRTYFPRKANWSKLKTPSAEHDHILERAVFHKTIKRGQNDVPIYIVADAWDGKYIRNGLQSFLNMTAGREAQKISLAGETVAAGGASHLIVFVGHNGLMDFKLPLADPPKQGTAARSAMVLGCVSKNYFMEHLNQTQVHPLLLTTGLMAPEAYTLNAAIEAWVQVGSTAATVEAAASAYHRYQKCGMNAARNLFWGKP